MILPVYDSIGIASCKVRTCHLVWTAWALSDSWGKDSKYLAVVNQGTFAWMFCAPAESIVAVERRPLIGPATHTFEIMLSRHVIDRPMIWRSRKMD